MNQRKYEALYIVRPDLADADVQKIAEHFKAVVEQQGGEVSKAGKWEKRKLAYEVQGVREGNYILMQFESAAQAPAELNRLLRISDDVLRHTIVKLED